MRQRVLQHRRLRLRPAAAEQIGGIAADSTRIRIARIRVLRQSRNGLLLLGGELREARQQVGRRLRNARHQRDRRPIGRLRCGLADVLRLFRCAAHQSVLSRMYPTIW